METFPYMICPGGWGTVPWLFIDSLNRWDRSKRSNLKCQAVG